MYVSFILRHMTGRGRREEGKRGEGRRGVCLTVVTTSPTLVC